MQLCKTVIYKAQISDVRIVCKKVNDATGDAFRFTKPSHSETKATNVKSQACCKIGKQNNTVAFHIKKIQAV